MFQDYEHQTWSSIQKDQNCPNSNLRLVTKAKGFVRMWAKRETHECVRLWEWTFTLPNELPCWELESQQAPKSSKSDCKGQNPSPWRFLYIIGKLLRLRCLKWARMTHLDSWNTSYGQKKGQGSNWQFDSRP
jgi:hypothetical protein